MQIERDGEHTSTMRRWKVRDGAKEYEAACSWHRGTQRMEWSVRVLVSPPQVQTHWRTVAGREVINAVREYENTRETLSA